MSAPDLTDHDLADRYGTRRPWGRRGAVLASVVVAVLFGGWLAWTTLEQSDPEVSSELLGFEVTGQHSAEVKIAVKVRGGVDPSTARCLLRAYAADHTTVGEKVFVPTGSGRYTPSVRTEREATSVESVGCTTPTQNRPR